MTRFWHRRSSEAIAVVAASIGGLFAWGYFGGSNDLNYALTVPLVPGCIALFTLLVIAVSYFTTQLRRKDQKSLQMQVLSRID
jgi:hypothetical protein